MGNSATKIVVQNGPVNYHGHAFREAADHKGLSLMLLSIDQIRVGKRLRQTRPSESLKLPKASADWAS